MVDSSRRRFVDWLLGVGFIGWIGSVFYPILQYIIPPRVPEARVSSVKIGPVADFPLNSGRIVKYGHLPVLVIRLQTGEFHAFSATCTHLSCTVQYRADWKIIWCACHNGRYDLNGKNIYGPPPRPLEMFATAVKDGELYVMKEAQA